MSGPYWLTKSYLWQSVELTQLSMLNWGWNFVPWTHATLLWQEWPSREQAGPLQTKQRQVRRFSHESSRVLPKGVLATQNDLLLFLMEAEVMARVWIQGVPCQVVEKGKVWGWQWWGWDGGQSWRTRKMMISHWNQWAQDMIICLKKLTLIDSWIATWRNNAKERFQRHWS